jgi:copper chaperone CopZ
MPSGSTAFCGFVRAELNVIYGRKMQVGGMVCDGCSGRVLETLQKIDGVKECSVDLETGLARVILGTTSQMEAFNSLPMFVEAVVGLGFECEPHFGENDEA